MAEIFRGLLAAKWLKKMCARRRTSSRRQALRTPLPNFSRRTPSWSQCMARRRGKSASCGLKRRRIRRFAESSQTKNSFLSSCSTSCSRRKMNWWRKQPATRSPISRRSKSRTRKFPSPRWPNSSGSSACWTKRLRAPLPPKPTPKRTSKTPAPLRKSPPIRLHPARSARISFRPR